MKKGWEIKKLGDMSKIMYGHTAKAGTDIKGPKYLRITDIQNQAVDWESVPNCPPIVDDPNKYKLKYGDIVFARTGATTGKSFLVQDSPDAVFASYLIRVQSDLKEIIPDFLYLFFQTPSYWNVIESGISGSAQGGFNAQKLGSLIIPIPPLEEQKKIVAILDETFENIEKARKNVEKNLQNAKELFQSELNSIYSQKGEGWVEKKLGDVCEIKNGGTPKTNIKEYWEGKVAWITPKDMGKLKIREVSDTSRKITELGLQKSSAKLIKENSIILSTRAPIGHLAINTIEMATNQGCRGIIPGNKLETVYLYYFLRNSVQLLNDLGSGTTFKELSSNALSSVILPLPSLEKQKEIVERLDSLSSDIKQLEAQYSKKLDGLEELKKSVLQKAFEGDLV